MSLQVSSQVSSTTLAGFPAITVPGATDRPPVLFIHGAFAGHEPFAGWMSVFARDGWRGIAVGRRGVRTGEIENMTIADYVDDTLKAIAALGETPIVVGHSLGGLIAQKVAELGRCRAAVLVAPAPSGMLTAQPVALPALVPMFPKILLGQPILPSCNSCATLALNCIPESERERIHARLVPESGKVYREMVFGTYRIDASKVTCPVLVMGGREDHIVSVGLMKATAERYRGELKLYDRHGHWLFEEPGWEEIAQDATGWLATAVTRNAVPLRATA